jgi:hypothetical protein
LWCERRDFPILVDEGEGLVPGRGRECVTSNDHARLVDSFCNRAACAGNVDGLVRGSVEKETVLSARRGEVADNLAGRIDVSRLRSEGGWRVDSSAIAVLIEKRMLRIKGNTQWKR